MPDVYLWYDIDTDTDGFGTVNNNDKRVKMTAISPKEYEVELAESELTNGSLFYFLFESESILFYNNYRYKLKGLSTQSGFETILLNNVIRQSDDVVTIHMPANSLGQTGKVYLYSISGDLVKVLLDGELTSTVLECDAIDKMNAPIAAGMYFLMFDFPDFKEVRRIFVK